MPRTTIILLFLSYSLCWSSNETHLANVRQLTFGGENAEAYFSSDGKNLIFQSTNEKYPCDQIFILPLQGGEPKLASTGKGRTTCGYFFPDGKKILFSSTHAESDRCPRAPDFSMGYVWPVYGSYDIYTASPDGADLKRLTDSPGYDAEATISPDGKKIVFTSDRDGDLEIYSMDSDGRNLQRLTNSPGYDGGAFYSPDSKQIVFRARVASDLKETEETRMLLQKHLVRPSKLELFIMDADGSNRRQITNNGSANFCPFFHPDGKRIIFASNMKDPAQRNFDLFLINSDGTGLEQITFDPSFDGFPMFSPDGKKLVFASNRNSKKQGETNIFLADWVESSQPASEKASVENLKKHVTYLASDELKGRLTGTPEAEKAASYIETEFKKYGLKTAPGTNSYFQEFEFTSAVKLSANNGLSVRAKDFEKTYRTSEDFLPTSFSEDGTLQSVPLAFAGYGIQAEDYNDYADLDVKGKAVIVFRFGPDGNDPKSPYALHYSLRRKALTAREKGAVALLAVSEDEKNDQLPPLETERNMGTSGIPVIRIKRAVFQEWLTKIGKEYPDLKNPHSSSSRFDLPDLQLNLRCELLREKSKSVNVIGWIPAQKHTEETIVIGAHYDHLGLGGEGSLADKPGLIHNGADDNASGVAGMLELARLFAQQPQERNLLFIAFGGEELGVLGSSHFVKNPPIPTANMVAMINLDMIGRLRDQKLTVGGTGTSPVWKELLQKTNTTGLKITMNEDGYGPSDHSVFYGRDIPVLFFFTGSHAEYHRPEDDPQTIEYEGGKKIVSLVHRLVDELSDQPSRPQFARVKTTSQSMAAGGFRVYLGTMPDYSEEVKGVKLMGVREGSPAEKAGIKAGDIIVEFAGKTIQNVYDYTYLLQDKSPGETVTIVVLRDGKRVRLQITLAARPTKD